MTELALFGTDLFGEAIKPKASGPVAERFTLPPFTILDARSGEWQERKRAWLTTGISSKDGRAEDVFSYSESLVRMTGGYLNEDGSRKDSVGTSVFDPVLVELAYRWFSPEGGQVVDPFAGGSVRGIVAGALGRHYWGCDLRPEQIAANRSEERR